MGTSCVEVMGVEQRDNNRLGDAQPEVGENSILIEYVQDLLEDGSGANRDGRIVSESANLSAIAHPMLEDTKEDVRHHREEERGKRATLPNANLSEEGVLIF